ncbi:hypothetical protein [Geoglobus acetivorans]
MIEMVCLNCGDGRFSYMSEDERFSYYVCRSCGNTSVLPKGMRIS